MTIPTFEKIETIVLCRLQNAKSQGGSYGTIIEFKPRQYKVYVDGRCFYVASSQHGWKVREQGSCMEAIDQDLLEAARNSVAA